MNDYSVQVRVEGMARGLVPQPALEFPAAQCVCTWSWGLQPATALIDWATQQVQAPMLPLSQLTIEFREGDTVQHTFYGICKQVAPTEGSEGFGVAQEFVDSREFLMWDVMYCVFNKRESRLVDNGTGMFVWQRRYWHIFPADFNAQSKTYTPGPLTAIQIMDLLFAAPTCESPWERVYHVALQQPVYDFDCGSGKKLGTCLVELSEALGCQFTLMGGRYRLVWVVRGAGTTPTAPSNSDQRRQGSSLSGNAQRVRLLGDRDVYQVMNLELEPDWQPAWLAFWNLDDLARDLFDFEALDADCAGVAAGTRYNAIPGDAGGLTGRYLSMARSRVITVGAYAALRDARGLGSVPAVDGEGFRDYRKFGGRSRLQMPAALYIASVLFRAFRPPRSFQLYNGYGQWLNLWALELVEQALVEVSHDPTTGQMTWEQDVISAGNGYAICQGYQVGSDAYKTLRPEHFKLDQWVAAQATWQHATFQVDDSGEGTKFIIFDAPVIRSADAIRSSAGAGSCPVLNASPVFVPPRVRASLIFAAEPYSYIAGTGTKDEVVNVAGLQAQFVCDAAGTGMTELPYADGFTANQKAYGIAGSLLNQQFTYDSGGYLVQGLNGTQLSEVIGRVTVRYSAEGMTEEVDYATERDRNVTMGANGAVVLQVPPERDFDRRAQLLNLLPGQRELREEARQLRLVGASLRQNPKLARTLLEAFAQAFGMDAMPAVAYVDPAMYDGPGEASGTVPAGTPLFKESGSALALSPLGAAGDVVAVDPVFIGATVLDGQRVDGPLHVTAMGDNGVVYMRVQGPASTNDAVGLPADPPTGNGVQTYLTTKPKLTVGQVLAPVGAGISLVPVRTNGAGGGGASGFVQCKINVLGNADYFGLLRWDGKQLLGDLFYAAKSVPGRMPAAENIDGISFTYSYYNENERDSYDQNPNNAKERQVMFPRFVAGQVVYVLAVDACGILDPDKKECKFMEANTAREWVRKYVQPQT